MTVLYFLVQWSKLFIITSWRALHCWHHSLSNALSTGTLPYNKRTTPSVQFWYTPQLLLHGVASLHQNCTYCPLYIYNYKAHSGNVQLSLGRSLSTLETFRRHSITLPTPRTTVNSSRCCFLFIATNRFISGNPNQSCSPRQVPEQRRRRSSWRNAAMQVRTAFGVPYKWEIPPHIPNYL